MRLLWIALLLYSTQGISECKFQEGELKETVRWKDRIIGDVTEYFYESSRVDVMTSTKEHSTAKSYKKYLEHISEHTSLDAFDIAERVLKEFSKSLGENYPDVLNGKKIVKGEIAKIKPISCVLSLAYTAFNEKHSSRTKTGEFAFFIYQSKDKIRIYFHVPDEIKTIGTFIRSDIMKKHLKSGELDEYTVMRAFGHSHPFYYYDDPKEKDATGGSIMASVPDVTMMRFYLSKRKYDFSIITNGISSAFYNKEDSFKMICDEYYCDPDKAEEVIKDFR